tara:strand:+ start:153 stop:485 length:333 start_codon:yes stop_codon:yes gene_type:complete
MITTITEHDFINAFKSWETYKNDFSYDGLKVLFEYLDNQDEELGTQTEFDVVDISGTYTEYETEKELLEAYERFSSIKDIKENTTVIEFEKFNIKSFSNNDYSSYIIRDF